MSGAYLTVAGVQSLQKGLLSVPSALPTNLNTVLQNYLTGLSTSVAGGSLGFNNFNIATGLNVAADTVAGNSYYEAFTNSSPSSVTAGGSVTVAPQTTQLVVNTGTPITVSGSANTQFALLGSTSDVTYSVNGGASSIYAAGGADNITALQADDSVVSAGNDTVTFASSGRGDGFVSAVGNATTAVYVGGSDSATVTASDNSAVSAHFLGGSGGTLDFINNSSQVATVYSGVQTLSGGGLAYSQNNMTAYGGSAGIFAVGGRSGSNSLNGGTGNSTLVGAGNGSTLITGGQMNYLYTGGSFETLVGGGVSNIFSVGMQDPYLGSVSVSSELVSATGSGHNVFGIGNALSTTLVGSTVAGSSNEYDINGQFTALGGAIVTTGGSNLTITDFGSNSIINLVNGNGNLTVSRLANPLVGNGTAIILSNNTVITLQGVNQSNINVTGTQITYVA